MASLQDTRETRVAPYRFSKKTSFSHWFLDQVERYLDIFVLGDEAAFCLNGSAVNTQIVREYSRMRYPL